MACVSQARGFDETEFDAVLENCLRDFPQVKVLRKEQKACLLNLARGKDVFAILPTGFGKSLIFQLFPRVSSAICSSGATLKAGIRKPESGKQKPESGIRNPESGIRKPELRMITEKFIYI